MSRTGKSVTNKCQSYVADVVLDDLLQSFLDHGHTHGDDEHDIENVDDNSAHYVIDPHSPALTSVPSGTHVPPTPFNPSTLTSSSQNTGNPSIRPSTPVRLAIVRRPAWGPQAPNPVASYAGPNSTYGQAVGTKRPRSASPEPVVDPPNRGTTHSRADLEAKSKKRSKKHRSSRGGVFQRYDGLRGPVKARVIDTADTVCPPGVTTLRCLAPVNGYTGLPAQLKPPQLEISSNPWLPSPINPAWSEEVQAWVRKGFVYLPSDPTKAQFIEDCKGKIIVVNAKQPSDPSWPDIVREVDNQLAILEKTLRASAAHPGKGTKRSDGSYKFVTLGVSAGQGQQEPEYLRVRAEYHEPLQAFFDNYAVQRYMKHVDECWKTFFPALRQEHQELEEVLGEISNYRLRGVFPGLGMMGMTANTGPAVRTLLHTDSQNASFSRCIIGATGNYDHTRSGLLVLKELRVIMEIAPGDVVFIPSALVTHGNTAIGEGETRRSLTFYTAGALFRWMDADCRMLNKLSRAEYEHFLKYSKEETMRRFQRCNLTRDELKAVHVGSDPL